MARSSSKNLETRFETLCAAYNELVERFSKLEKIQKTYAELYKIDSNTLSNLITKLHKYGYLDKPKIRASKPLPKINASGCKIIKFDNISDTE